MLALLASSAITASALSGCVTEEIGPTGIHTTAYVEHDDAPSADEEHPRAKAMSSAPSTQYPEAH